MEGAAGYIMAEMQRKAANRYATRAGPWPQYWIDRDAAARVELDDRGWHWFIGDGVAEIDDVRALIAARVALIAK